MSKSSSDAGKNIRTSLSRWILLMHDTSLLLTVQEHMFGNCLTLLRTAYKADNELSKQDYLEGYLRLLIKERYFSNCML